MPCEADQPCDVPCDEGRAYQARCGAAHAARTRQLLGWRHRRGLFFELTGAGSGSGLGQVVSNALLLHSLCVAVQRFCYLRVYDFELSELMGYAGHEAGSDGLSDGLSWGPPSAAELQRYSAVANLTLRSNALFSGYGAKLLQTLRRAPYADAPLVHVRTPGPLRFSANVYLPVLPGERSGRAAPRQAHLALLLDRCFCHYVTAPRGRGLRRGEPPEVRATVTHQIRTGYADVPSVTLKRLHRLMGRPGAGADSTTMETWLALACPSAGAAAALSAAHVLTDSPVLAAHIARPRGPFRQSRHVGTQGTTGSPTVDLLRRGSTRSWAVDPRARRAAFADMVRGGRSRAAYLSASSFGRPMVARSVCLEHVHYDRVPYLNQGTLNFLGRAGGRSKRVCSQ